MLIRILALLLALVLGGAGGFFLLLAFSFWGSGVETRALAMGLALTLSALGVAWWAVLGARPAEEPPA